MKKQLIYLICILIISVESTVIIICFSKTFPAKSAYIFESDKNTFTVSNSNLWLYVHLTKEGSLGNVYIDDGINRLINFNYTDLGIVNYEIIDKSCGYEVD
jgi:hypothetical protein